MSHAPRSRSAPALCHCPAESASWRLRLTFAYTAPCAKRGRGRGRRSETARGAAAPAGRLLQLTSTVRIVSFPSRHPVPAASETARGAAPPTAGLARVDADEPGLDAHRLARASGVVGIAVVGVCLSARRPPRSEASPEGGGGAHALSPRAGPGAERGGQLQRRRARGQRVRRVVPLRRARRPELPRRGPPRPGGALGTARGRAPCQRGVCVAAWRARRCAAGGGRTRGGGAHGTRAAEGARAPPAASCFNLAGRGEESARRRGLRPTLLRVPFSTAGGVAGRAGAARARDSARARRPCPSGP
jgi:hypothetical protein